MFCDIPIKTDVSSITSLFVENLVETQENSGDSFAKVIYFA